MNGKVDCRQFRLKDVIINEKEEQQLISIGKFIHQEAH